jgi:hypothetical protein
MKRATAQALVASIFRHRKNLEAEHPDDVSLGSKGGGCPLCQRFGPRCVRIVDGEMCPIRSATRRLYCSRSPSPDLSHVYFGWIFSNKSRADFLAVELRMIEFMQALLPRNLADNLED